MEECGQVLLFFCDSVVCSTWSFWPSVFVACFSFSAEFTEVNYSLIVIINIATLTWFCYYVCVVFNVFLFYFSRTQSIPDKMDNDQGNG